MGTKPRPLRDVPYMGVIYVVAEAAKLGYYGEHPDWCNLGQGMPEVGPLPGAPERVGNISIHPDDHAYGPVAGLTELREAEAEIVRALQLRSAIGGRPARRRPPESNGGIYMGD
jgi:hypothetical protein